MTNDSTNLNDTGERNASSQVSSKPLQPVLKLDVVPLDKPASSALLSQETPSRESLFTLYTLLYDKVSNFQKDERKQTLVYQELCKQLNQLRLIKVLPQIDTIRSVRQRYCDYLDSLIIQISLDIDRQYASLNIEIGDLFPRNKSHRKQDGLFVMINTHHHQILNSDPNIFLNTSRLNDFINYGLIERGGFGSVYKMKNITDKCLYAVKLIPFKSLNQLDATKIMQEVYLYAQLPSHQNIVSYKSSWLHNYIKEPRTPEKKSQSTELQDLVDVESTESSSTESSESRLSKGTASVASNAPEPNPREQKKQPTPSTKQSQESLSPPSNQPEPYSGSSKDQSKPQIQSITSESSSSSSKPLSESSSSRSNFSNKKATSSSSSENPLVEFISSSQGSSSQPIRKEDTPDDRKLAVVPSTASLIYCVLCIQMELCSFNLRVWIDKRNNALYQGKIESINYDEAIDIFIQIVRGVHHLHSHNLIHRDIKPQNILFSVLGVVKIGDFGLTTIDDQLDDVNQVYKWSGKVQKRTRGLGTSSYSAPEQQKSSWYNYKADIYSLGLIAFELLYPLFTNMERSDRFDELKNQRKLPEELEKYPAFVDLILETVQSDPEARPGTSDILEKEPLLRHGWKMSENQATYQDLITMNSFLNDKVIKLEKLVQSKDEEIIVLKKKLESLENH